MGKKLLTTPRSKIRAALRQLWLRSRERSQAMSRDKYTCQNCGKKQSRKKGQEVKCECHHLNPINWDLMIDYIQRHLLVNPDELECLCVDCHAEETQKQKE